MLSLCVDLVCKCWANHSQNASMLALEDEQQLNLMVASNELGEVGKL